ncbi:MAG: MASE3 domain-containing protein [Nitrospirota bacterium]
MHFILDFIALIKRHKPLFLTMALATVLFFYERTSYHFFQFHPETYLWIQGVTEGVSILICVLAFAITWHTFFLSKNHQNLFLGVAFLAVGILDAMHALSYYGMPDFITRNTVNKANFFWISSRLIGTFAYLSAAFVKPDSKDPDLRPLPLLVTMLTYVGLTFIAVIFLSEYLPAMYVPGTGPTPLMVRLEYLTVAAQAVTAVLFIRIYVKTKQEHYIYFIAALVISIFAEIFFTLHAGEYDTYSLLGHIYKVAMFLLIYQTLFTDSIKKPYMRLIETEGELRDYALRLEEKVEERTRALALKNAELEQFNRLKTDLLAICSHDMKSPIQGSLLTLELLEMEAEGPLTDDQRRSLDMLKKNENEMLSLVTNLLDLARREENALSLKTAPVEVRALVKGWQVNQALLSERRNIAFSVNFPSRYDDLVFDLDEFKLHQVLNNLMSNALKHTSDGGRITLDVDDAPEKGWLLFSLYNSGAPIAEEKLDVIFEKYVQADEKDAGTGLGLSICKMIVEMHGGRIWAEQAYDGNLFLFTLPPAPIKKEESSLAA